MFELLTHGFAIVIGMAVSLVLSYAFARIVTLAYFHSRADYETIIRRRRLSALPNQQLEGA